MLLKGEASGACTEKLPTHKYDAYFAGQIGAPWTRIFLEIGIIIKHSIYNMKAQSIRWLELPLPVSFCFIIVKFRKAF